MISLTLSKGTFYIKKTGKKRNLLKISFKKNLHSSINVGQETNAFSDFIKTYVKASNVRIVYENESYSGLNIHRPYKNEKNKIRANEYQLSISENENFILKCESILNKKDSDVLKVELYVDKINCSKYQEIQELTKNEKDELRKLNEKLLEATPKVKKQLIKKIERGTISDKIKSLYKYECQLCKAMGQNPFSFIDKKTGNYYVETHHIIPVSELEQGSLSVSNLITLCATHHRQFHNGNIDIVQNDTIILKLKVDDVNYEIQKITF